MKCKYCDREIKNKGTLKTHEKSCEIIQSLDIDKLRKMYYEEFNTIEEISKIYKISHQKMSKLLIIKGKKRKKGKKNNIISYVCQYCDREVKGGGNLKQHEKSCENINIINGNYDDIKDEIINLYVNEYRSIRYIRKKYRLQSSTVKEILGDNVRSLSEASKLNHKLYPEKYRHSDETKDKLRKIRLNFMKNNPEKTAWRKSNMSYPEKLFLNKMKELKWNEKHLIVREKSLFPYFIDFAFINEKVAVEIDGSQHNLDDRVESDRKKDIVMKNNGWRVFRVTAKEVITNMDNVISMLEGFLDTQCDYIKFGILTNKEYNLQKKYYCGCGGEKSEKSMSCEKCYKDSRVNKLPRKHLKKDNGVKYYCGCGEMKSKKSKVCSTCYIKECRTVERPPYSQLLEEISSLGYTGTGRKYNVSDNAIRKWEKNYEKNL